MCAIDRHNTRVHTLYHFYLNLSTQTIVSLWHVSVCGYNEHKNGQIINITFWNKILNISEPLLCEMICVRRDKFVYVIIDTQLQQQNR